MSRPLPPDQPQREQALDPACSILVQAPAGSGKTDLLTRRFLRLLGEVDDPTQIVAITFTKAAAAEMRHRILSELEKAAALPGAPVEVDAFSMPALARRALARSRALGWQLPDLPAQLRISTIDSFCRELAIQQPLLSGFASDLTITDQPAELYRRAARATLARIGSAAPALNAAIEALLAWRDNNWSDLENQLVQMLAQRDRWMQDFVLDREPDWDTLRERLERPFARAVADALDATGRLLDQLPQATAEALALARFACAQLEGRRFQDLAELADFPAPPFDSPEQLEAARAAFVCLADLLLTADGTFRSRIDKTLGFPADRKAEKARLTTLIADVRTIPGFEAALAAVRSLPPARYTEDDWRIVRACFTLLRQAVGELHIVFASAGAVDFIEVAQIAQRVLVAEDGLPSDAALAAADGIHHLLVDEFQDTSRRQHSLLARLVAAWPDPAGRTLFVVGDPMQSIYFFRDADAELFPRVQQLGLELPGEAALALRFVKLGANFRTAPALVDALNQAFDAVFAANDGSGISFSPALPARPAPEPACPPLTLHLEFTPQTASPEEREAAHADQTEQLVDLIRSHLPRAAAARTRGEKYRIAVLGRARKSLVPIARALREAAIPFLAVELEQLTNRPEVLDALALGRALLNPLDRVAWLSVLRAPWCGLALADLHALTSADDPAILQRAIPELLAERIDLVSAESRSAVGRVVAAASAAGHLANALPTASLGTWLEQVWLQLGGASCVDNTARANLDLLWNCLDLLPNAAQDLLSPALDTALKELTALPDAEADSECGVQLMTMHKSKGLEFEVVIVPDLQAASGRTRPGLLSWLERGLAQPDDSGAVTEFLVAPLPSKGAERGGAKAWVDRVYREREAQEMRRILYVAATRAREELHLFARPTYKLAGDALALAEPSNSLLATAWPALAQEVQARFDAWQAAQSEHPEEDQIVEDIAAEGSNILVMPSPDQPAVLQRLPADFHLDTPELLANARQPVAPIDATRLYARHEGGTLSRALGRAVHSLLEETAHLRTTLDWPATREALPMRQPRIVAQLRASGLRPAQAESVAARALEPTLAATHDPYGQWLLSPRTDAASEAAFAGVLAGTVRTVRVDRLFRAGLEPLSEGSDALWIVDYKTAHADDLDAAVALPEMRRLFAPQLETYAAILHRLNGAGTPLRAALYYPRMSLFDWWEISL